MKRAPSYSPLLLRWIKRAARAGSTAEDIARRFNQEASFVRDLCRLHGIPLTGVARPDHVPGRVIATEHSTIGIRLANEHLTTLEREAGRRGTTAPLLAGEMLNLIVKDSLFAAVLD